MNNRNDAYLVISHRFFLIFVIILWVFCRFERIFVIELVGKRELVEAATAC